MNIRRRFPPGMRVKKFHKGGKGPGYPHKYDLSPDYIKYALVPDSPAPPRTSYNKELDVMSAPIINISELDSILVEKHGTGDYKFSEFRDAVRHHEGGTQGYSAIQKPRKDGRQGPGRGGYQFDPADAATAYQRLKNIAEDYDFVVPKLTEHELSNMNTMSPELQDLLFTANFMGAPNSRVTTVLSDKSQWADQWAKGHWKGKEKDYNDRIESFDRSLSKQESYNNPIFPMKFLD